MSFELHQGDCVEVLATLEAASLDAIVTDPPYGLEFMGMAWDTMRDEGKERPRNDWGDFGSREHARTAGEVPRVARRKAEAFQAFTGRWAGAALRVLKPGAHLVAFGGPRTFHRLAAGLEDAGFELRDCLAWLYGSGYPKSRKVAPGWGTALKPGWEPVVLARAPLEGSATRNVAAHGTGGLHVDACRLGGSPSPSVDRRKGGKPPKAGGVWPHRGDGEAWKAPHEGEAKGRWPANVLLDGEAAAQLDDQAGPRGGGIVKPYARADRDYYSGSWPDSHGGGHDAEAGPASRFYYTAKASPAERNYAGENEHPTVKPVDLMRWLCRLVTPPGGCILDPFMGSGSTGIAALAEGFRFVGIEREAEWVAVARRRIAGPLFAGEEA